MKNGLSRFTFYTQKIEMLLDKAGKEKNPAMWLFINNTRTPFFMLEGLAKIYAGMHNAKKFGKLKEHFKLIEDGLGQIDYYQWLSEAFAVNKQIPEGCRQIVEEQLEQKAKQLNEVLADKGWLSGDNKRLKKTANKLDEIDWLKSDKEVEAISDFYNESVAAITRFVAGTDYHFDNIEEDVHELRRKLRWLSIYPQALQGVVQYAPDIKAAAHLKKYLTEEIITSPYNKLPAAGSNTSFLLVRKNYFLALSWVIAELGNIKDEGLLLTGLCEAIKQSSACSEEEALAKAYTLLGRKQRKMQTILDDAEAITRTFFKERNLQYLVAKTTSSR
ncbi:MAG: hypothetical protein LLG13_05655 [Bacteroidales bacterium]|nr:hypothetical protein [Bacteroidales bacterium]